MSPLSVEYCRRAKGHLAANGSPLGAGTPATVSVADGTFSATAAYREPNKGADSAAPPLPPRRGDVGAMPVASVAIGPPLPPRRPAIRAVQAAGGASAPPLPPRRGDVRGVQVASLEPVKITGLQASQARRARSRHMWANHEERLRTINSKVKASDLRIAAGG